PFLFQLLDRVAKLASRGLGEAGQADETDLVLLVDHEVPLVRLARLAQVAQDAGDLDLGADDGDVLRLAGLMTDAPGDLLAWFALDPVSGLAEARALGRLAVDLDDDVARKDAGVVGRRVHHRTDDRQLVERPRIVAQVNADAAELSFALVRKLLVFLF